MSDYYCKSCYRPLRHDRDLCFDCERQPRSRAGVVLIVIAVAAVIAGMLGFDMRLCAAGAVVAVIGLIVRLFA